MNLKKAASAALVAAMTMSAAAPTVMAVEASMPITAEDSTATVPDDVQDDTLGDTSSAVEDRAQGSARICGAAKSMNITFRHEKLDMTLLLYLNMYRW